MREIVVSFVFFIGATFLLFWAHRVMLWHGRRTLAIFLVYPLGFLALLSLTGSLTMRLFYVLMSLLSFIFLITPVLGDQAPTSRIMRFLREHPDASYRSIVKLFRDKDMVGKRLGDLAAAGLVRKQGARYTSTAAGAFVAGAIAWYLKLISWEPSV